MASKFGEITEEEVAYLVLQIGGARQDRIAPYDVIRAEIPRMHNLSSADLVRSVTRPNEAIWEQKIRNIKSHYNVAGNYICEGFLEHMPKVGYRVTDRGLHLLRRHAA